MFYSKKCNNSNCIHKGSKQSINNFHNDKTTIDGLSTRCKDCIKIKNRKYRINNPGYDTNRYKSENYFKNKERIKQYQQKYVSNNLYKFAAKSSKRRALLLKATPSWLSVEQLKTIENFYRQASVLTKQTGIKHEVDHIIPLNGKNVKGMHVPWNLQILTKTENIRKKNL